MQQVAVVDEEAVSGGCVEVLARFDTIQEAEDWIQTKMAVDPDKVQRGGYGIDAPEELINP